MDSYEYILKNLVDEGKSKGYLTYDNINDVLPRESISADQIDDLVTALIDSNVNIIHDKITQSDVISLADNAITVLMNNILERELRIQKVLFRMPFATDKAIKILKQKNKGESSLFKKFVNSQRSCRESFTLLMNADISSDDRQKNKKAITNAVEDISRYARSLGLTRGDMWQIFDSVNNALQELEQLTCIIKDFDGRFNQKQREGIHVSDIDGYNQQLEEVSVARQKGRKLMADFCSPLQSLEKSVRFIKNEQKKIMDMRDRIFKAYAPIIKKLTAGYPYPDIMADRSDLQQEGHIGLLKAFDLYPYNDKHGFQAFAVQAIKGAMYAASSSARELAADSGGELFDFEDEAPDKNISAAKEIVAEIQDPHGAKEQTEIRVKRNERTNENTEPSPPREPTIKIPNLENVTPALINGAHTSLIKAKSLRPKAIRDSVKTKGIEELLAGSGDGIADNAEGKEPQGRPVRSNTHIEGGRKLSLIAAIVGRRAEEIVIKHLVDTLSKDEIPSLCWVSREGNTPGWDIEYVADTGAPVKIEVKGTTGKVFPSVDISGNEWKAAEDHGDNYWLYIVTECLGTRPQIDKLNDPHSLVQNGNIRATPLIWRLELNKLTATE